MKLPLLALLLLSSFGFMSAPATHAPATRLPVNAGGISLPVTVANVFNLADFGAAGNGVDDAGPALQNALDALGQAGGGTLFVPAGRYAITTPVHKDFSGLAVEISIIGVESSTPPPPPNSGGQELTRGLDLLSEFAPRTREQGVSITIRGLEHLLIKDIGFIGTPDVLNDALITLAFGNIREAKVSHCEFYGLRSLSEGGAIIQAVRSGLNIERSVFLGSATSSGVYGSIVENIEWKSITVTDTVFVDYGQRPELFGKLDQSAPFAWVNIGNAAALTRDSPRREAVLKNVFLDEGAFIGLTSLPNRYLPASAPIDLVYVSGLYMNVSNLNTSGFHLSTIDNLLVEDSHYGWSQNTDSAITLLSVRNAILDRVECSASADRIRADAATGNLTIIDSVYNHLDSLAQTTRVIHPATADDDAVQYVRRQFIEKLGRDPDPAAHFYWSDRILRCLDDAQCAAERRIALDDYLASSPQEKFAVSGRIVDENGVGMAGITLALSGSQNVTTGTGPDGRYEFSGLPTSGVYQVTPSRAHYTLSPARYEMATPAHDQVFDAAAVLNRFEISGRVTDAGGTPLTDVTVTLGGSQSATTTSAADGKYAFTDLPAGGVYTITPAKTNYLFGPTGVTFNDLSANQTGDFQATLQSVLEFSAASYRVAEDTRTIAITVTRAGDSANKASVTYSASNGSADQRSDVIPVIGRLAFAPGETSKTFIIFITDDVRVEADETINLELSDMVGGILGDHPTATLTILDNDSSNAAPNPIDDPQFFVRQHYRDFLSRPADSVGLAFWSNQISSCGTDAACLADRRMNVSAAFFLSIEFQQTGFLVYRLYQASFGQAPRHLDEFLLDTRTIGAGVIVNAPGWEAVLAENTRQFIENFVTREKFWEAYPSRLTPAEFVNQLDTNSGGFLSATDTTAAVAEFAGAATSEAPDARARVLRRVAENQTFSEGQLNTAFVLMQYFGYLQRNPSDQPDSNLDGYNFWLGKLEEFDGDFRRAEMVKSFLVSGEYRARFGTP